MKNPFFDIIITGYNMRNHIGRCLHSLSEQDYNNFKVHILSDDDSVHSINFDSIFDGKFNFSNLPYIYNSPIRKGKALLIYEHLHRQLFSDDSVSVIIDADDRLYKKDALSIFATEYKSNDPDICWSTYIRSDGKLGHSLPIIKDIPHRVQGWRSSHCFTFKSQLFKKIPIDYIFDAGKNPVMSACDIAIALPLLDISKKNSFIPEILYYYEINNPLSHHNQFDGHGISSKRQMETATFLYGKKPLIIS